MMHANTIQQAIGGLGPVELIIILVIVLLIFGAGKLPQIGDALGKSIRAFKKATTDTEDAVDVTPKSIESKATEAASETVEVEATEQQNG